MLPRSHRLNSRHDFQKVYAHGKFFSAGIILLNCKANELQITRIGYVVSKKVSLNATVRNNIRRKLRELTRKRLPEITPGYDVIITFHAKPDTSREAIATALEKVLRKSNLLH